jgi:hypothetical protein
MERVRVRSHSVAFGSRVEGSDQHADLTPTLSIGMEREVGRGGLALTEQH